jgi:hypothetical protein
MDKTPVNLENILTEQLEDELRRIANEIQNG